MSLDDLLPLNTAASKKGGISFVKRAMALAEKAASKNAKDLLAEPEAAKRLHVSKFTLARYRKDGQIAATKLGNRFYYSEAAMAAYIERKTTNPCPSPKTATKSETSTLTAAPALPSGKPLGTTGKPDKLAALLSAQQIFMKPKPA